MLSLLDVLAFGEGGVEAQPDNLNCASGTNDHPCRKLHDSSFGGVARKVLPERDAGLKQHYSYLALANPLVAGGKSYFDLADDNDEPTYKLGEDVIEELCSDGSSDCERAIHDPDLLVCPDDGTEPSESNKLARITLDSNTRHYRIPGGYCAQGVSSERHETGSSDPSQKIIIAIKNFLTADSSLRAELRLDNSKINYDGTRTYYLYIGSKRYSLNNYKVEPNYRESCGSTHRREIAFWQNFLLSNQRLSTNSFNISIASEKNKVCEFYTP